MQFTGLELKRIEAKHQLAFMLARVVNRKGELGTLERIMGTYCALKYTSLTWDFTLNPRREPLFFATWVFEGFWPADYGNKKKRVMEYLGKELLRIATSIDERLTRLHSRHLVGTEWESLNEFNKRYQAWMKIEVSSGSRGRFPCQSRTVEGEQRLNRYIESRGGLVDLGKALDKG